MNYQRERVELIYQIFKPILFRDVQNLYQEKTSMDTTLKDFKRLTSTCWNEKNQPLTLDKNLRQRNWSLSIRVEFINCSR